MIGLAVAAGALALDAALGDPPNRYHPTAWMGAAISQVWRASPLGARGRQVAGAMTVLAVAGAAAACAALLGWGLGMLPWAVAIEAVAGVVLLKSAVAARGMGSHAMAVHGRLVRGDIDGARAGLASIVKRKTGSLDDGRVASGAIESVGENTVDGITGPLFWFFVLGLPGALAYRAVNTADSMIGYKTPELRDLGRFAALADTALNYIPARLTVPAMAAAAALLGHDWRGCLRCAAKEGNTIQSRNAGYPMAAMAGALGVRLEKEGHYRLGTGSPPGAAHIPQAVNMMKAASWIFLGLVGAPAMLALWWAANA